MRNLKIVYMLLIAMFLSGCTVTYNIDIKDSKVYENISILQPNTSFNSNDISGDLDASIGLVTDDSYIFAKYNFKKNLGQYESGVNSVFEYPLITYTNESSFIKSCYEDANITIGDTTILLKTTDYFRCWSQFNGILNVNITTDYKVVGHNADSFDNNVYTWTMTKDDNDDTISIEFEIAKINDNTMPDIINNSSMYLAIILIGAIALIGVGIYLVQVKNKENNRI